MGDEEIMNYRDAIRSKLRDLSEARRRLMIEAEAQEVHANAVQHAGHVDDGNLMAPSDDNFYPLDEPDEDTMQLESEEFSELYNPLAQHLQVPDYGVLYLQELYNDDDISQDHIDQAILARRLARLHVPHIIGDTPSLVFNEAGHRSGFGGVPASAAAIAGLKQEKYDGLGPDSSSSTSCVICMKDYKEGKRLLVMPCKHMHRFHGKCLKKWLSRSYLCPLCRHALPTTDEQDTRCSARSVPI